MMRRKKWIEGQVDVVDSLTGAKISGIPVMLPQKIRYYERRYLLIFLQEFGDLARGKRLTGTDWNVLMLMLESLEKENAVYVSQTEVAKTLGIHRPDVCKSVKKLVGLGIILPGPKFGQSRTYRLSDVFGWKGTGQQYQTTRALRLVGK